MEMRMKRTEVREEEVEKIERIEQQLKSYNEGRKEEDEIESEKNKVGIIRTSKAKKKDREPGRK